VVEVGASERGAYVEMRLECLDDPFERVEVRAVLVDKLVGGVVLACSKCVPLVEPPSGSTPVEGGDIELVDQKRSAGHEDLSEPPARLGKRVDVVKGDDRDRGVERLRRLIEAVERDGSHVRAGWRGIDRDHVVASDGERAGEVTATGADLENTRRRGR
jgi:hypothetical protein